MFSYQAVSDTWRTVEQWPFPVSALIIASVEHDLLSSVTAAAAATGVLLQQCRLLMWLQDSTIVLDALRQFRCVDLDHWIVWIIIHTHYDTETVEINCWFSFPKFFCDCWFLFQPLRPRASQVWPDTLAPGAQHSSVLWTEWVAGFLTLLLSVTPPPLVVASWGPKKCTPRHKPCFEVEYK